MGEPFVINVADARAVSYEGTGVYVPFEDPSDRFPDFGINIHMLSPGEPSAKYHAESVQEAFLVLSGECTAIVNGEERTLRQWDFFHCPAGTEHVFVGAGSGPCWILMVGARRPDATIHYPTNESAARQGASAPEPTDDARRAYADWPSESRATKLPWPPA
jgi:uncharacterized cupin superfamily protein